MKKKKYTSTVLPENQFQSEDYHEIKPWNNLGLIVIIQ